MTRLRPETEKFSTFLQNEEWPLVILHASVYSISVVVMAHKYNIAMWGVLMFSMIQCNLRCVKVIGYITNFVCIRLLAYHAISLPPLCINVHKYIYIYNIQCTYRYLQWLMWYPSVATKFGIAAEHRQRKILKIYRERGRHNMYIPVYIYVYIAIYPPQMTAQMTFVASYIRILLHNSWQLEKV